MPSRQRHTDNKCPAAAASDSNDEFNAATTPAVTDTTPADGFGIGGRVGSVFDKLLNII